jgi:transposase
VQSRTLPAVSFFRARLILALADGMSYREIEGKLGASWATVSKWKGRFQQQGREGLQDGIREASRAGRRR